MNWHSDGNICWQRLVWWYWRNPIWSDNLKNLSNFNLNIRLLLQKKVLQILSEQETVDFYWSLCLSNSLRYYQILKGLSILRSLKCFTHQDNYTFPFFILYFCNCSVQCLCLDTSYNTSTTNFTVKKKKRHTMNFENTNLAINWWQSTNM